MMDTNNICTIEFEAWNKHVKEEFNRIMQEYEKVKKEIEEEGSSADKGIDNGKVMLDHMMLADQQNRMFEEHRRITEQNYFAMQQQNEMVINMLHYGF